MTKLTLALALFAASAAAQTATLRLSWTDNSNNEHGFVVERSVDAQKTWVRLAPESPEAAPEALDIATAQGETLDGFIGTTAADDSEFADRGAPFGADVEYRVVAYNRYGFTGYTNVVMEATRPPKDKPSGLKIILQPVKGIVHELGKPLRRLFGRNKG